MIFQAMLEGNFKEKNAKEIPLPGKKHRDMELLLQLLHPLYAFSIKLKGKNFDLVQFEFFLFALIELAYTQKNNKQTK